MDLEDLREKMVSDQLISRDIHNEKVLTAFRKIPRHKFLPKDLQNCAYEDRPLPVGEEQTISQPYIVALMTQSLQITPEDRILEIGTGSGYQSAILAELAKEVFSVERFPVLAKRSQDLLLELGYKNIKIKTGDGTLGWQEYAPYDAVIITAAAPKIPQPLIDQLKPDGLMVLPIGAGLRQSLTLVQKINAKLKFKELCSCTFVPLIGEYGWKE